jgi:pimeloyl-ACP methyl ester carboxylesterase
LFRIVALQSEVEVSPRRRLIGLARRGEVAALEFGPEGRGLDVVFLHANGFNAMTYRRILAPLGTDLRVLAVDLRGHGRSRLETPAEAHSWLVYARDLVARLQALGEVPSVLAGHSMGGTSLVLATGLMPAAWTPKLALFDPVLLPEAMYASAAGPDWDTPLAQGALRRKDGFASLQEALELYRGRGAFRSWPNAMVADYLEDGLTQKADGLWRLTCAPAWEAANFASYGMANPYPALAQPRNAVRIMCAEQDSTCHFAGDSAAEMVTVETVPGTTHFLPMERPELVRSVLCDAANK